MNINHSAGQRGTQVSFQASGRLIDVIYRECATGLSIGHHQVNEPKRPIDGVRQRRPGGQQKTANKGTSTGDMAQPDRTPTPAAASQLAEFCDSTLHPRLSSEGDNTNPLKSPLNLDYGRGAIDASQVRVDSANISDAGVTVAADVLSQFNLTADTRPTMLVMPGVLLMTNHLQKQEILRAIEELQYRQDELKVDFSRAILALVSKLQLL